MEFKLGDLLILRDDYKQWILKMKIDGPIVNKVIQVVGINDQILYVKVFSKKDNETSAYSSGVFRFATDAEIKKFQLKEMF